MCCFIQEAQQIALPVVFIFGLLLSSLLDHPNSPNTSSASFFVVLLLEGGERSARQLCRNGPSVTSLKLFGLKSTVQAR